MNRIKLKKKKYMSNCIGPTDGIIRNSECGEITTNERLWPKGSWAALMDIYENRFNQ